MNCKDFIDFLNSYTDGELQEKLRASFEKHMGNCSPCRHFLDGYKKTSHLAHRCSNDSTTHEEPPEALVRAILAACAEVGCSGSKDGSGDN